MYLTNKSIDVVVPCYMDEGNIEELVSRLNSTMSDVTPNWGVIYVNDASPDNSEEILKHVSEKYDNIDVLTMSRNFGVMSAFKAGIDHSKRDAVVLMDGDLQDPPELIPEFVKCWLQGNLVVYGVRKSREEGVVRKVGYNLFYKIWKRLSDIEVPVNAGEFALIDSSVYEVMSKFSEQELFLRGVRSWTGFPQCGLEYKRLSRYDGESTQSLLDYIRWAIKAITSFSVKPLRYITFISFVFFSVLSLFLLWKLVQFFAGHPAPDGFFTIISIVLIASSVQLLVLSIISEYVANIAIEVKQRPQYIVRSIKKGKSN